MSKEKKLIKLGTCQKPHGIKGEFSFHLFNTEDSSLKYIKNIFLIPLNKNSSLPTHGQEYIIEKININKKTIARLKGVDNRNLVEEMIPFEIHVLRDNLKDLSSSDEYYLSDLIGLKVIGLEDEDLGVIENYYDNGVQEILVINGETQFEVPLVDQFVIEVNIKERYIRIRPIEYL